MLKSYIKENYKHTIRENKEDNGTLLALPFPYTVPCADGMFQEMYYWDTYFTNIGLIKSGYVSQALNNTNNILYMIDKYGYMPNGNRTFYLKNSQPPFASMMVKDLYEITGDKEWLKYATEILIKEDTFWRERRGSKTGLSIYGVNSDVPSEDVDYLPDLYTERLGFKPPVDTDEHIIAHFISNCESGWDINPRFEFEGYNYNSVDLNSLLYALEKNISYFLSELERPEDADVWNNKAELRAETMRKYMLNDEGIFLDYNFEKNAFSPIFSAASYYPLFVGLTNEREVKAAYDNLARLEFTYGISSCEKNDFPGNYQWSYPNGWPPVQYIIIKGLLDYGYIDDAKRIAEKYINIVEKNFEETHNIWEKYNIFDCSLNMTEEYETPAMLGWTAGIYLYCKELLG